MDIDVQAETMWCVELTNLYSPFQICNPYNKIMLGHSTILLFSNTLLLYIYIYNINIII